MKKKHTLKTLGMAGIFILAFGCNKVEQNNVNNQRIDVKTSDLQTLATTSSEIISGFSFGSSTNFSGNSSTTGNYQEFSSTNSNEYEVLHSNGSQQGSRKNGSKGRGIKSNNFSVDGISLLAINDTLLAINDFENVNDQIKNLQSFAFGGATITHYDAAGNVITNISLPISSLYSSLGKHRNGQNLGWSDVLNLDSIISTIAKTVIDFGSGVSLIRHNDTVTRSGQITINRSGTYPNTTQAATFSSYFVNGIGIEGSKTISRQQSAINDSTTQVAYSVNGTATITFADANTATLSLSKSKTATLIKSLSTLKWIGGNVITTADNNVVFADGSVLYKYITTTPINEDLSCTTRRKPKNGVIDINYLNNVINVNFAGDCSSYTITVFINGVVYTKTI